MANRPLAPAFPHPPTVHEASTPSVSALRSLLSSHPIPPGRPPYKYGTAGFRYPAPTLPPCLVRVGILAAIRSASCGGEAVGVMVTASHNPAEDNGCKIADPDGGMLAADWEASAVELANAPSGDAANVARRILRERCGIADAASCPYAMVVHLGRDTRAHSAPLAELAALAAGAMGARVVDHGVVTTPQLHHAVRHANPHRLPAICPVRPGEGGYLELVVRSYLTLLGTADGPRGRASRVLTVDGACGVGHPKLHLVASAIKWAGGDRLGAVLLVPVNAPGDGPLNVGCGAEHVQKNRLPPLIYSGEGGGGRHVSTPYGASVDGDADRVVFHYNAATGGAFRLLDGDKIAVLIVGFVMDELRELRREGLGRNLRCGIVQTAYANGAATAYVAKVVRAEIACAKTGVKYVHAAAHDRFDVGVYFEANGHGTVLFSPSFYRMIDAAEARLAATVPQPWHSGRAGLALHRLRVLPSLVNQAVGDAISDVLLVDAILYLKGWSIGDWDALYEDLPSRQCKVKVGDRSIIRTDESEARAVAPPRLQPALDSAMEALDGRSRSGIPSGGGAVAPARSRCFVRPSGTENAVRVYAEASTQADADGLASEAAALVHGLCGGVGRTPSGAVPSRL